MCDPILPFSARFAIMYLEIEKGRKQMKKVAGYIRVSSLSQKDGVSLSEQRRQIKQYCKLYKLELCEIYEDIGSAKNIVDRKGLVKLLHNLEKGAYDAVCCSKLDRLSRSIINIAELNRAYFSDRYSLYSVSEQIDTSTASGKMMLNILVLSIIRLRLI